MRDAVCDGAEGVEFVPDEIEPMSEMPAFVAHFCSTCPVRQRCLDYAIATESTGWWGGQLLFEGRRTVRVRRGEVALLVRAPKPDGPKLSEDDVAEIRRRWRRGGITQEVLGEDYGVGVRHIRDIVSGRRRNGRVTDNGGERHGLSKLSQADVEAIRERYAAGGVTMKALGSEFGITASNVSQVVNFRRWNRDETARPSPGISTA